MGVDLCTYRTAQVLDAAGDLCTNTLLVGGGAGGGLGNSGHAQRRASPPCRLLCGDVEGLEAGCPAAAAGRGRDAHGWTKLEVQIGVAHECRVSKIAESDNSYVQMKE